MAQAAVKPSIDLNIEAPPLHLMTKELFRIYRKVNGLTDYPEYQKVAKLLGKVTEDSDLEKIRNQLYLHNTILQNVNTEEEYRKILEAMNVYFHLTAIAQESRRLAVDMQYRRNMWQWLGHKRKKKGLSPGAPLVLDPQSHEDHIPQGAYVPGQWVELLFPYIDYKGIRRQPPIQSALELVEAIEQITVEKILTQHPTNVNPVELNDIRAKWAATAAEVMRRFDKEQTARDMAFVDAARVFGKTPQVMARNFIIGDEIAQSHHKVVKFLYGRCDMINELVQLALARFGSEELTPALQLRLAKGCKALLGDWAAYDKDGNPNVKSEHRLAKLVQQRLMMTTYYEEELERLSKTMRHAGRDTKFFDEKVRQLQNMSKSLKTLDAELDTHRVEEGKNRGDIILNNKEFNSISDRLNAVRMNSVKISYADLAKDILKKVEAEFMEAPHSPHASQLLGLAGNLEQVGLFGCHNEQRENCKFNHEVILELIKNMPPKDFPLFLPAYDRDDGTQTQAITLHSPHDFQTHSFAERREICSYLSVMRPDLLQAAARKLIADVDAAAQEDRSYYIDNNPQKPNTKIMAYHALRTMGLSQKHQDCHRRVTMAETEESTNILDIIAIQVAMHPTDRARAHWLEIAPLFEQIKSYKNCLDIKNEALTYESYQMLLVKVGGRDPFMVGHSDGGKEAGRYGQNGLLGLLRYAEKNLSQFAHRLITWSEKVLADTIPAVETLESDEVAFPRPVYRIRILTAKLILAIYHGKSHTDISRSGGANSAATMVGKEEALNSIGLMQGGDSPNYGNSGANMQEIFTNEIVRAVKICRRQEDSPNITYINRKISEAAAMTAESYNAEWFGVGGILRRLLARVFPDVGRFTNVASRGVKRSAAAVQNAGVSGEDLQEVNLDDARAIPTSIATSYALGNNSWAKADAFHENFVTMLKEDGQLRSAIIAEMRNLGLLSNQRAKDILVPDITKLLLTEDGKISAENAKALYDIAREWRRNIDQPTQGMAMADFAFNADRRSWFQRLGMKFDLTTPQDRQAMYTQYCVAGRLAALSFGRHTEEGLSRMGLDVNQEPSLELAKRWHEFIRREVLPQEDRNYLQALAMHAFYLVDCLSYHEEKIKQMSVDTILALKRIAHSALNNVIHGRRDVTKLDMSNVVAKDKKRRQDIQKMGKTVRLHRPERKLRSAARQIKLAV